MKSPQEKNIEPATEIKLTIYEIEHNPLPFIPSLRSIVCFCLGPENVHSDALERQQRSTAIDFQSRRNLTFHGTFKLVFPMIDLYYCG